MAASRFYPHAELDSEVVRFYRNLQHHRSTIMEGVRLIAFRNINHMFRAMTRLGIQSISNDAEIDAVCFFDTPSLPVAGYQLPVTPASAQIQNQPFGPLRTRPGFRPVSNNARVSRMKSPAECCGPASMRHIFRTPAR